MRYFYTVLLYITLPFIFLRLLWRSRRLPAYRARWAERLGFYTFGMQNCIWVHAVSVGETIAALPLIKSLQAQHPELPILVTTMTPTGSARVQAALGDSVKHVYLPYDLPGAVARFLRSMRPRIAIFMETELWPNLLAGCRAKKVPVYLLNARLSARSARGYQRIASVTREMLEQVEWIAASAKADAERFIALGARPEQISVVGNIKFDLTIPPIIAEQSQHLRAQLGNDRFVWIAASTHEGEEDQILEAHQQLCALIPNALLILVPRHPDRFEQVAKHCARSAKTARRSKAQDAADASIYLADSMGELLLLYSAADVAFVGGSLITRGGHNILEPAALGKPVVTGPHLFNFADIERVFKEKTALIQINNAKDLTDTLLRLARNPAEQVLWGRRAREVVETNRGALQRQLALLQHAI